jgi:hypothetical protein
MATCYTRTEYYQLRDELENKYKIGADMLLWIDEREPNTWCRYFFGKQRYGVTTSNTIEVVFNTLNMARGYSYLVTNAPLQ